MRTSLRPQQVPLLEKHVGHVAVARIHDDPLDPADVAVAGVDVLAAGYLGFPFGDPVGGDGLRDPRCVAGLHTRLAAPAALVGPGDHLLWAVVLVAPGAGQELRLVGQASN